MKLKFFNLIILFAIIGIIIFSYLIQGKTCMIPVISNENSVCNLFPKTIQDIEQLTQNTTECVLKELDKLYAIPKSKRNFENTVAALDKITEFFLVNAAILKVLTFVHPIKEIRDLCGQGYQSLENFSIDYLSQNIKLYESFKEYTDHADLSKLDKAEKFAVDETLLSFERSGLNLSQEKQDILKKLRKQLAVHENEYENNINNANDTIEVSKVELEGLSDDFIEHLSRTADNKYILGVDYPTYLAVMENCEIESTRKKLWTTFINRGYPANEIELSNIVKYRNRIAKLLGYETYADYDISDEMAKTPLAVKQFLNDLLVKSKDKLDHEVEAIVSSLPQEVTLTKEKKIKPWDIRYINNYLKKKNFNINEHDIAQYFPLENTLTQLFSIYESFFGLELKLVNIKNLWHEDIKAMSVYKSGKFLGYILLDLFPRPNKYGHACEITIVPTFDDGKFHPALILVIANFPKATANRPSLLLRHDVITFFHEFGHAIHAILGCTRLATQSGAKVKHDFVEMPSQMLEQWMWQPEILKKVSSHYQTKQPLSDEIISKIIYSKNLNIAEFTQRQIYQSFLSLDLYNSGKDIDIFKLNKELYKKIIKQVEFQDNDHFYANFGHLIGYGSKYYSYLWSKVFALDLFDVIKKNNFSKEIGQKYINTVLSKGGGDDPMNLLANFLGRKPNSDAFFADMGLNIK